jgi:hypothetical protein
VLSSCHSKSHQSRTLCGRTCNDQVKARVWGRIQKLVAILHVDESQSRWPASLARWISDLGFLNRWRSWRAFDQVRHCERPIWMKRCGCFVSWLSLQIRVFLIPRFHFGMILIACWWQFRVFGRVHGIWRLNSSTNESIVGVSIVLLSEFVWLQSKSHLAEGIHSFSKIAYADSCQIEANRSNGWIRHRRYLNSICDIIAHPMLNLHHEICLRVCDGFHSLSFIRKLAPSAVIPMEISAPLMESNIKISCRWLFLYLFSTLYLVFRVKSSIPASQIQKLPIIVHSIHLCVSIDPAYGCGAPEMWLLTAYYSLECIIAVYFWIAHVRTPSNTEIIVDSDLFFWVTTLAWSLYHAITGTVYFDWSLTVFLLFNVVFESIRLFGSLSFLLNSSAPLCSLGIIQDVIQMYFYK